MLYCVRAENRRSGLATTREGDVNIDVLDGREGKRCRRRRRCFRWQKLFLLCFSLSRCGTNASNDPARESLCLPLSSSRKKKREEKEGAAKASERKGQKKRVTVAGAERRSLAGAAISLLHKFRLSPLSRVCQGRQSCSVFHRSSSRGSQRELPHARACTYTTTGRSSARERGQKQRERENAHCRPAVDNGGNKTPSTPPPSSLRSSPRLALVPRQRL